MNTPTIANNDAVAEGNGKRPTDQRTVGQGRLLSLKQAAAYVGVSYWLLRDYVIDGTLQPVRLPGSRLKKDGRLVANSKDHHMRKIMLDREDLDRLISESKG
jgi:hypothetical protein